MSAWLDFFKSFFDSANDRLKNPLISTFIISWIAFNWKALFYLLLSDAKIEEKIFLISSGQYTSYLTAIVYPLSFVVFYLVGIPYIMFGIDKLINWAIGKRRKNAFDLKEKDINNKITIVKMEAELDSAKNNHRNLLDLNNLYGQHENEIIRIKTDIRSLFESVGNIKNNIDAAAISKVEEQSQFDYDYKEEGEFRSKYHSEFISTDLFKYFPSIGLSVSKSKSIPENINELVVEKFITEDIIKRTHDASTDKYYMAFTKKGYSFWKQYLASTPLE